MIFRGKKILHSDHFVAKAVYAHYFPKLIKGVAMEFVGGKKQKSVLAEDEAKYTGLEFLDGWEATANEVDEAVVCYFIVPVIARRLPY